MSGTTQVDQKVCSWSLCCQVSCPRGQDQFVQKHPPSSARFLCIFLFLIATKPTKIVALPPQVQLIHIHFNILRKESDVAYILKFIVGEGNGFNRLRDFSTPKFWPGKSFWKQNKRGQGYENVSCSWSQQQGQMGPRGSQGVGLEMQH